MLKDKKILGLIPARGGSRRVPFKNITLFRGQPLIRWTMEHAEASKYLDAWVVSTEDAAIAIHAKDHLLKRPAFLADDKVPTEAVLVHALYTLPGYDYAVLLQPTSPLRTVEDIDRCIEIAVEQHGASGLTGCVSYNEYGKRNGAVFVCNCEHFLQHLSFDAAHHYEMPNARSLDINYPWEMQ
jgi:N-acylneuraminate cytidylyltransferase